MNPFISLLAGVAGAAVYDHLKGKGSISRITGSDLQSPHGSRRFTEAFDKYVSDRRRMDMDGYPMIGYAYGNYFPDSEVYLIYGTEGVPGAMIHVVSEMGDFFFKESPHEMREFLDGVYLGEEWKVFQMDPSDNFHPGLIPIGRRPGSMADPITDAYAILNAEADSAAHTGDEGQYNAIMQTKDALAQLQAEADSAAHTGDKGQYNAIMKEIKSLVERIHGVYARK